MKQLSSCPRRVALLCTPRTGNTWLRMMIGAMFQMPTRPVVVPDDIPWDDLPDSILISIHWPYDEALEQKFREHQFRLLVLARHPFDVLLSVLRFSHFEGGHHLWLGGQGEESILWGATPRSRTTITYGLSTRFDSLCRVSTSWWERTGVQRLKYESLLLDPIGELTRLAEVFDWEPAVPVKTVVERHSMTGLKEMHPSFSSHLWQGRSLWKELISTSECEELRAGLIEHLSVLDYATEENPETTPQQADVNWQRYWGLELRERLRAGAEWAGKEAEWVGREAGYVANLRENEETIARLRETVEGKSTEVMETHRLYRQLDHRYRELEQRYRELEQRYRELESSYTEISAAHQNAVSWLQESQRRIEWLTAQPPGLRQRLTDRLRRLGRWLKRKPPGTREERSDSIRPETES